MGFPVAVDSNVWAPVAIVWVSMLTSE